MRHEPTSRVAAREPRVRAGLRLRRRQADSGSFGLRLEGAEPSETRAGAHVRTDAPSCAPDDRLLEVCHRLDETGWDTCFVLNEEDVVLGRIGRRAIRGRAEVRAEDAMTLGPSTIRPSARLEAMVERMRRQSLKSLPVTISDGRLVGLLTLADAEMALARLSGGNEEASRRPPNASKPS